MMGYEGGDLLLADAACAGGRVGAWSLEPVVAGCGRWPKQPGTSVSVMRGH